MKCSEMNSVTVGTVTTGKTAVLKLKFKELLQEINTSKLRNYNPFFWDSVHQQLASSDSIMANYMLSLLIFDISVNL